MPNFTIKTRLNLDPEERKALFGWGDDLWDNDRYALTWRGTDVYCVGYVDDEAVSNAGAVCHSVQVGNRRVTLGGLNSVITVPAARGKGYGSQVVGAVERHMQEEMQVDFGMLFCHPELIPFYKRRGWQEIEGPVTIDQPEGPRETPHIVMVLPFCDEAWTDEAFELGCLPW